MNYLASSINHLKAIDAWMKSIGAEASIDMSTMELEIRCRHRYFKLFPQFLAKSEDGKFLYEAKISESTAGFIGWKPYKTWSFELSTDKLLFKRFLESNGKRTPEYWAELEKVESDYVIKNSQSSFGDGMAGPFRVDQKKDSGASWSIVSGSRGQPFAEKFIRGDIVKAWFWGDTLCYAQRRKYPQVIGDGHRSLGELTEELLAQFGHNLLTAGPDRETISAVIRFQQLHLDDVLEKGKAVWLDYRYGRSYSMETMNKHTNNSLPGMNRTVREQIESLGRVMASVLQDRFHVPVLFSLDGVVDEADTLWWLEMNSNPTFPPDCYPLMLASLFGPVSLEVPQGGVSLEASLQG